MEPDLVIHKYPCNKFGGFNEIDNKFLSNKIIVLKNKTNLYKFDIAYVLQFVFIILIIFAMYILYIRYQTRWSKEEKEHLIVDLYNTVHKYI